MDCPSLFDDNNHNQVIVNNSSDGTTNANNNQEHLKLIEEEILSISSPPLSLLKSNNNMIKEDEIEEDKSSSSSIVSSKLKKKRKSNVLKKMLRLGNHKSKFQVYANTTCDNDLYEKRQQPENPNKQCNQQSNAITQKISSCSSSNASNKHHTRDLSTLSTTPLTCLEDDVQDFLIDLSKNSIAAAYLEKERTSIKEMKVMEAERRKDLERLQHQETQRQSC